jgi:hypothetical protein
MKFLNTFWRQISGGATELKVVAQSEMCIPKASRMQALLILPAVQSPAATTPRSSFLGFTRDPFIREETIHNKVLIMTTELSATIRYQFRQR